MTTDGTDDTDKNQIRVVGAIRSEKDVKDRGYG
jgi:hypothetical protein